MPDSNNETLEQTYTDASGYTMKAVKKDWRGNTVSVNEWSAVSPVTAPSPAPDIITRYEYDYLGNCTKMTNPATEITNYAYDVLNRLSSVFWPDTTTETIVYDANGNRDTFTDRNGDQTKYHYDSLNQVRTVETYSGTTEITSTTMSDYTQFGTPKEITGLDGDNTQEYKFTYSYDGLGRLTTYDQYTGTTTDALHHAIANTYDASGVVDTMSVYEGSTTSGTLINALDFDPNDPGSSGDHGTVSTIRQLGAANPILKMTNTFWGGLDTIEYGLNGTTPTITAQYGYDELLRPASITGTKTTSGDLMQLGYTYDYQGNVQTWTGTSVIPRTFTYDGMNRLASETTTATTPNVTTSYTFDEMGNRTTLDKSDTTGTDTTYGFTAPNNSMRLMNDSTWTYEYDNNGNMTKKYKTGEYWFYFYDQYNRLRIAVLSTDNVFDYNDTIKGQYMYDANGLRILKIEDGKTTIYIYSGQTLLFEETYNTENPSQFVAANRTLRELNIVAGSLNLAKYKWIPAIGWGQANAILHYHLLDHLGSRQVTTDVNGNAITDGNTEYATYGAKTAGAASETSFTGKKFDTGIGLYYFNARYYDSITGRFITQDPIKDGTNWYVYCENNPVNYVDENGREMRLAVSKAFVIGNHVYVYSTEIAGPDGQKGMSGSSSSESGNGGGDKDKDPYFVIDTKGLTDAEFMAKMEEFGWQWHDGIFCPWLNDCHSNLEDAFQFAGLVYPGWPAGRLWVDEPFKLLGFELALITNSLFGWEVPTPQPTPLLPEPTPGPTHTPAISHDGGWYTGMGGYAH